MYQLREKWRRCLRRDPILRVVWGYEEDSEVVWGVEMSRSLVSVDMTIKEIAW